MIDHDTEVKHWLHPAVTMTILKNSNENNSTIQIFTDGSKSEQGVGAGIAVYRSGTHTKSLKYRLNKRCTNNQAEQLGILKSLKYIETIQTTDKTVTVYTDSQTTLDSLKNNSIHTSLIKKSDRKRWRWNRWNRKFDSGGSRHMSGSRGTKLRTCLQRTKRRTRTS